MTGSKHTQFTSRLKSFKLHRVSGLSTEWTAVIPKDTRVISARVGWDGLYVTGIYQVDLNGNKTWVNMTAYFDVIPENPYGDGPVFECPSDSTFLCTHVTDHLSHSNVANTFHFFLKNKVGIAHEW
jgi:hypothetical protein